MNDSTPESPVPGRTFSLTAALVLILGSIVVPVIGALVGLVWVSMATAWSRREKLIAWVVPTVVVIAAIVVAASTGAFEGPLSGAHTSLLLAYLVFPIEGIVLARRAHNRGWRSRSTVTRAG
jgi:ABC-type cobalamin transport system permease subunit